MSVYTSTAPSCVLLPRPFPGRTFVVGDLLTDPTRPATALHTPALGERDYDDTRMTAWYKDIASLSLTGNFAKSLGGERLIRKPRRASNPSAALPRYCSIEAEKAVVRALKSPFAAFCAAVRAPPAPAYLCAAVRARKPVYFVAAVKELTNASYARAAARDAGNGLLEVLREPQAADVAAADEDDDEAATEGDMVVPAAAAGLPHRRRDSAFEEPTCTKTDVLGVEVREVRVKLTRPDVPHTVRDLELRWTYLALGEGEAEGDAVQLAVGLGAPLDQEELADLWADEEIEEEDEEEDE